MRPLVRAWGDLGVLWGIPRTTARIQGLLLASRDPLSLDEIAATLDVSKGGGEHPNRGAPGMGDRAAGPGADPDRPVGGC